MGDFFDKVEVAVAFDDVLLKPSYSEVASRSEVDVSSYLTENLKFNIPLIPANMNTVVDVEMIEKMVELGGTCSFHRYFSPAELERRWMLLNLGCAGSVGISIGVNPSWYEPVLETLMDLPIGFRPAYVIIDVAHGDHLKVVQTIHWVKKKYPSLPIIAGNVCTRTGALRLANEGVSAIKCGVGPSRVCTTRIVTACGHPQLSAIKNISCAIKEFNENNNTKIKVIADGGICSSGDCVKCYAAGADFVMIGGMLSGTDETPGEILTSPTGEKTKIYAGMASSSVQSVFFEKSPDDITPEGISMTVPCKGPVEIVIKKLIGGIRSGMSYCGCRNIAELQEYGEEPSNWVRVTNAGYIEGTPHGLRK